MKTNEPEITPIRTLGAEAAQEFERDEDMRQWDELATNGVQSLEEAIKTAPLPALKAALERALGEARENRSRTAAIDHLHNPNVPCERCQFMTTEKGAG